MLSLDWQSLVFDWQSLVVYITIGVSVAHLVRVFRHPLGDEKAGGGCGSCGTSARGSQLLQIEPPS